MKVVKFIILATIIGCCFSTTPVVGNDTVQAPADSIIVSDTPIGGGDKDFFEVKSEKGNLVSLKIFDRSGTLIYSAEAKKCGWNGRSSSGEKMEGVYFYLAEVSGVSPKITGRGTLKLGRVNSKNEWVE